MIFLASIIYDGYYLDDYQLYSDRHVELVPGDYMGIRKVQEGFEPQFLACMSGLAPAPSNRNQK